jgi:hypothetical protein
LQDQEVHQTQAAIVRLERRIDDLHDLVQAYNRRVDSSQQWGLALGSLLAALQGGNLILVRRKRE